MASQLTRKELKQDKFAVEVEHTVDFFTAHRRETIRYGGIVLIAALIVGGFFYVRNVRRSDRQQALADALTLANAPVGAPSPSGGVSFPNEGAKDDAVTRALQKIISDYSGSQEDYIAEYYLAAKSADAGRMEDARRRYQEVADHADANYASLAKLALAQVDLSVNRTADAEKLLKDLMDHPTDLVSKAQATIAYAKAIGPAKPAEARKLLTGIVTDKNDADISQIALSALNDLPQQ